ncbi:phosphate ABC transporter permease subunit PstC [Microbacterium jejuense]|uniref:Phosphate transport system permease protein n=1 Tax=Microbacterium jejuense TaxID=1263637 RepID=A0ABS7HK78_9MICO|nr:phosphate ABC transporter permease subunit PstC [Microbacterium jejuense]MBW9093228.1 phosphate ABC transporter permease subunit PstC [Microbacterium jejuense]
MADTISPPAPAASRRRSTRRVSDTVFLGLSATSAVSIMVILAGVAIFLIIQGLPAITANWADNKDLSSIQNPAQVPWTSFWEYVGPLLWGSVFSALIAMVLGAPVAIGIALFISHYAPRRIAGALGYIVDLLAAVPSIVFGLWGIAVMRPFLLPLSDFLNQYFGWIPFFAGPVSSTGSTMLAGGVVLAVMILPIVTSITREIFLQTPRLNEEAALALGATRWEMIRLAVLPYARSGMISATLLGMGRALGETMAIALIMSPSVLYSLLILTDGYNSQTIAANIALNFPVATEIQRSALIGTGLMLFVISFAVNMLARFIIGAQGPKTGSKRRRKEGKGA